MKNKHFTNEEKQIIKKEYEMLGAIYCSTLLENRSPKSISYIANKMGLKRKHGYSKFNFNIFDNITPSVAYFLGILWADGSIYTYVSNNITHCHIRLELIASDMNEIHDTMCHMGKWSTRTRQRNNWKPVSIYNISSKPAYNEFKKYGYDNKLNSPSIILDKIPPDLHFMFWRGFFDGDGCISFNKNYRSIKFSGHISQNWSDLSKLCDNHNIKHGVYIEKTSSSLTIQNKKGVHDFIQYLYSDYCHIGFPRKQNKCINYIKSITP